MVNKRLRRWAKRAEIKKHVTCHTFRHSVATHLLKNRADIRHIQALLCHQSLKSTERYTRVELSDLRKVIARAHPRGLYANGPFLTTLDRLGLGAVITRKENEEPLREACRCGPIRPRTRSSRTRRPTRRSRFGTVVSSRR